MAKNRRRKTGQRRLVEECTCALRHDVSNDTSVDHESWCELWHLEDFMMGLLDWNPLTQRVESTGVAEYLAGDPDTYRPEDSALLQTALKRSGAGASTGGTTWTPKVRTCRHNMTQVTLPDGTVVHASGAVDVRKRRLYGPTWAVYLCSSWTPDSLALFVPWQDYGTPNVDWNTVRNIMTDFYRRAQDGETVEVGCMGGHGRTGTFLACLVALADPTFTAQQAIAYVRKHYCPKAVEDRSQVRFVEWFIDPTLPPRPEPIRVKSGDVVAEKQADGSWKAGKMVGDKFVPDSSGRTAPAPAEPVGCGPLDVHLYLPGPSGLCATCGHVKAYPNHVTGVRLCPDCMMPETGHDADCPVLTERYAG